MAVKLINQLSPHYKEEDMTKYSHEELCVICRDMAHTLDDLIHDYNEVKLRLEHIEHAAYTAKQRTDYIMSCRKEK